MILLKSKRYFGESPMKQLKISFCTELRIKCGWHHFKNNFKTFKMVCLCLNFVQYGFGARSKVDHIFRYDSTKSENLRTKRKVPVILYAQGSKEFFLPAIFLVSLLFQPTLEIKSERDREKLREEEEQKKKRKEKEEGCCALHRAHPFIIFLLHYSSLESR